MRGGQGSPRLGCGSGQPAGFVCRVVCKYTKPYRSSFARASRRWITRLDSCRHHQDDRLWLLCVVRARLMSTSVCVVVRELGGYQYKSALKRETTTVQ